MASNSRRPCIRIRFRILELFLRHSHRDHSLLLDYCAPLTLESLGYCSKRGRRPTVLAPRSAGRRAALSRARVHVHGHTPPLREDIAGADFRRCGCVAREAVSNKPARQARPPRRRSLPSFLACSLVARERPRSPFPVRTRARAHVHIRSATHSRHHTVMPSRSQLPRRSSSLRYCPPVTVHPPQRGCRAIRPSNRPSDRPSTHRARAAVSTGDRLLGHPSYPPAVPLDVRLEELGCLRVGRARAVRVSQQ